MNHARMLVTVSAASISLCTPALAGTLASPASIPVPSETALVTPSETAPVTDALAPPQGASATSSSDKWRFTLRPYMWFASIDGDVTADSASADVDLSFNDIWDNLDFAVMLAGEARKGNEKWALAVDTLYLDLEDDGSTVDVTLKAFMGELDFVYQLGPEWLEVLAGARYWNFDAEIDTPGPNFSKSKDWVDPILGARATCHPFNEQWTARLRADGGGFDVGSKGTFQVLGAVDYAFNESFSVAAGYRHLAFEYDGDNADYDIRMSGPLVGLTWSF